MGLAEITKYTYRVLSLDAATVRSNVELEIQGERIVYAKPAEGPELSIRLNTDQADAIPLTPKSEIIAPFKKLYLSNSAGSGTIKLYISSPADILMSSEDLLISSISSVERTSSGSNGSVSMTAASATVLASNSNRKRAVLTNTGVNNVYISLDGGAAVVTDYALTPGESMDLRFFTGAVTGICDTGLTSTIRYYSEG